MFFKGIIFLSLAILLSALGCGIKVGEKPPAQVNPEFNGRGYTCVGQIPTHIKKYADDELSDTQISEFFSCLQKSFTTFALYTRGQDQNTFKPEEIRSFLQYYFFKDRVITDRFMNEIMVMKRVFVGGEQGQITRSELNEFIQFLDTIKDQAIRVRPFVKFLNPALVVKQDPKIVGDQLTEAQKVLSVAVREVSGHLKGGSALYRFENLEGLMVEFRRFVGWEEQLNNAKPVKPWVNFFKTFKQLTVSPDNYDSIRVSEWAPLLEGLSRWYLAYVGYRAGIQDQPILYGMGLQNTVHLAEEIFELAHAAILHHPDQEIPVQDVKALILSVQELGWMTSQIRQDSVDHAFRAFMERMFDDGSGRRGLTLGRLQKIKYDFYRWANIQLKLNAVFNREAEIKIKSHPEVPTLHSVFTFPSDVKAHLRSLKDTDWDHFLKIKTLARPLFNDNLNRVILVNDTDLNRFGLSHEFNNLSMMNVMRSMVGIMFRGYMTERKRELDWSAGVTSQELQNFYEDIRELAVDLELADVRIKNTGERAFIEGNLFTYAANGLVSDVQKSRLDYIEAVELLSFLYSGGKTSADFYHKLSEICELGGGLDQNNMPKVKRSCVRENLANLVTHYGVNMPGMIDYMEKGMPINRAIIADNLMQAAFSHNNSDPKWVERAEISTMAVVLHYLEAVLTRFDTDRDGVLTNTEIRKATAVFMGFIQRIAEDKMGYTLSDIEAEGVFLYILKYKQIPTAWSFLKVYNLSWDKSWTIDVAGYQWAFNWNDPIELDRTELSTVFKVIVQKISELPTNQKTQ